MKKKKVSNEIEQEAVVKNKKRSKSTPMRLLITMMLIAIMGIMIVSIYKEVTLTLGLQKDIDEIGNEIANLNNTKDNLERQKENLNDPNYVEQYARGKYKLTKEGETIYKLPGKTTTDDEEGE